MKRGPIFKQIIKNVEIPHLPGVWCAQSLVPPTPKFLSLMFMHIMYAYSLCISVNEVCKQANFDFVLFTSRNLTFHVANEQFGFYLSKCSDPTTPTINYNIRNTASTESITKGRLECMPLPATCLSTIAYPNYTVMQFNMRRTILLDKTLVHSSHDMSENVSTAV